MSAGIQGPAAPAAGPPLKTVNQLFLVLVLFFRLFFRIDVFGVDHVVIRTR
jgi:hypothetical protein